RIWRYGILRVHRRRSGAHRAFNGASGVVAGRDGSADRGRAGFAQQSDLQARHGRTVSRESGRHGEIFLSDSLTLGLARERIRQAAVDSDNITGGIAKPIADQQSREIRDRVGWDQRYAHHVSLSIRFELLIFRESA